MAKIEHAAFVCSMVCAACLMAPGVLGARVASDRSGGVPAAPLTKPRVAPLPEAEWTEVHRKLVTRFSREGRAGNDLRTLLHVPDLVEAMMPFYKHISSESSLPPRDREILILRAAWLCRSEHLWARHVASARRAGLLPAEIRRIAQGPDARGWEPFDATLVRAADQLYRNAFVNDATWNALAARYDMYRLMDAVMTVGDITMLSSVYNSLGVQPDEGADDRLPTDIPYRVVVPKREPPPKVARVEPLEGTGLAIARTFARYPKLAEPRSMNTNYVNRVSKLSPRHREILILRIGWDCESEYEWAQHVGSVGRARDYGVDPLRVAQGPDAPGWDGFEAMLLRAADELHRDAAVSDSTWSALAARFDATMMMNVLITASNYRMVSTALNALGVQLEPGDERFPDVRR